MTPFSWAAGILLQYNLIDVELVLYPRRDVGGRLGTKIEMKMTITRLCQNRLNLV